MVHRLPRLRWYYQSVIDIKIMFVCQLACFRDWRKRSQILVKGKFSIINWHKVWFARPSGSGLPWHSAETTNILPQSRLSLHLFLRTTDNNNNLYFYDHQVKGSEFEYVNF